MEERHFCVSSHGCAVHDLGYTDRRCSCREYWSHPSMTEASWSIDHDTRKCHKAGGACTKEDVAFLDDVSNRLSNYFLAVKEGRLPR